MFGRKHLNSNIMRFIIEETNELAGKWAAHYIAKKIN
jgi:hypothetical protein